MNKFKIYLIALTLGLTLGLLIKLSPIGDAYSVEILHVDSVEQTLLCSLEATHIHAYTNESGPTDGIEYWARTNKFRIYLHDDFMSDVDLDTLECSSGSRYIPCDGGTSTSDGGTSVRFVQNDTSSDAVYPDYVEWTYGNTTATDSPIIPGYNNYEDGTDSMPESDRTMGEYLTYDFIEDGSGDASTTSAVYIKFWAYDMSDGTWTAIPEDGKTDYHWNNDTGTDITHYSCPSAGCATMTITPDTVGVDNLYTSTDFEVTAYDTDGNDITADLTDGYSYNATGEGYFKFSRFQITQPQSKTTTDTTFAYADAGASDSFTVEAVGYEDACHVEIEFPFCRDLSITSPSSGTVTDTNYSTDIDVTVRSSERGVDWPFDITYSSDDASATFDGNPTPYTTSATNVAYSSSTSAEVNVVADHDTAGTCNDSFSYTLIPPVTSYCTDVTLSGPDSSNCWTYTVNSSGITPTISATGYTDSTKTTAVSGVTVTPDDSTGITGKICWPDYTKGNYLYVYVPGYTPMCEGDYVDTSTDTTPPGGDDTGGGGAPTGGYDNGSSGGIVITPPVIVIPTSGMNGTLDKFIYTFNFADQKESRTDNNIFFSHDEDYSFYTLEYDPQGGENSITFNDTMWNEDLGGYLGDGSASDGYITIADRAELELFSYSKIRTLGLTDLLEEGSADLGISADSKGMYWMPYLSYDNETKIEIPACTGGTDLCYDSAYEPLYGSVVMNNVYQTPEDAVIRIRYVGRVHATEGLCDRTDDPCLTETFDNFGSVETGSQTVTAEAKLVVLCSYLVTRNAGDVYLEQALPSGTDLSCIDGSADSSYANVEGIIVQEDTSATASGFCTDAGSSSDFISNLSSYVCEIVSAVSDLWGSTSISITTEERVSEEVRNAETLQGQVGHSYSLWQDIKDYLKNANNPDSGILYFKGTPGAGDQLIISQSILIDSGAWTLIVEDADLVINGNITYADTTVTQEIPSVGFVVLGGDIYIGSSAHNLYGVYYTDQGFDGDERSAVNGQLEIYGSIYGDVSKLLQASNYVGSPNLDGGGIVVRYDSRILLNTPPGLGEYIDVNSEKAVN